jgi:hypothetical protein
MGDSSFGTIVPPLAGIVNPLPTPVIAFMDVQVPGSRVE